jgi:Ca2+-binding EF-hand superfamily protein
LAVQIFTSFDANGDGDIDHDEFKDGLAHLGAKLSMSQLEDLITMLDHVRSPALTLAPH